MLSEEHIAGIATLLVTEGLMEARHVARASKLLTEFLSPDYIPRFPMSCPMAVHGKKDIINPRLAPPGVRCARQTSYDYQSGPIYCGNVASVIADSQNCPGAYYAMCKRCWRDTCLPMPEK